MKQIRLLCLIIVLAICPKQLPAEPESNGGKAMEAVELVTKMKLTAVSAGDISCYVTGIDDKGSEQVLSADFDLCPGEPGDVSNLIGLPVQLTWGKANVLSASCDGNFDCGRSDYIDIVKSLTPVRK